MTKTYTIMYQQEPEWWYTVRVEELQGCVTYGETFEEATAMIHDAMEGYLDIIKEKDHTQKLGSIAQTNRFMSRVLVDYETV